MDNNKYKKSGTHNNGRKANADSETRIQIGNTTIQTPDDLVDFISNEKDWFRLLIDKPKNFSKLLEWISRQQGDQNGRRFDSLMTIAKPKGAVYVREALLRFINPVRSVCVINDLDVFSAVDPEKTVKDFTVQLEEQWRNVKPDEMLWYLFSFGIAFEHMIRSSEGEKKTAAENILERIARCFKYKTDQPADASTPKDNDWILLRKNITDEGLVNLFYEFNPERTFCDNEGNRYPAMKEIALLFAAHPEYWDDRFLKEELNGFLRSRNLSEFIVKNREAFLLKALVEYIEYDIDIIQTFPGKTTGHDSPSAEVVYRITRNVNQFLEDHGIKENLSEEVDRNRILIPSFLSSTAWDLAALLLKELDKKYTFTENRWANYSVGMIQENFTRFQDYLRENSKIERKSTVRKYAWQSVQSFFILFPVVVFYFLCVAYFEKNFRLINFLSSLSPLIMTFDDPWVVESKTSNFGLPFLVLFSVLPALILTFRKEYLAAYIGSLIIWLSLLGPFTFLFPLPVAGLTLLGIPVLILTTGLYRIKVLPLFISSLLLFVVIFSGDIAFRDTPPSAGIKQPINVSARVTGWEVFRSGPSESHSPVGLLEFYDTVNIIARDNGWSLIRFKEAEGYIQDSLVPQLPMFYAVVTDSSALVMSEPSLNSRIIEVIYIKESVSVFGAEGDWLWIRRGIATGSGNGYIQRKSVFVVRE